MNVKCLRQVRGDQSRIDLEILLGVVVFHMSRD
jgi:hypothetical protein